MNFAHFIENIPPSTAVMQAQPVISVMHIEMGGAFGEAKSYTIDPAICRPRLRQDDRMSSLSEGYTNSMPQEIYDEHVAFGLQPPYTASPRFSCQTLAHLQQNGGLLSNKDHNSELKAAASSITCLAQQSNFEEASVHVAHQRLHKRAEANMSTKPTNLIHGFQDKRGDEQSKAPEATSDQVDAI